MFDHKSISPQIRSSTIVFGAAMIVAMLGSPDPEAAQHAHIGCWGCVVGTAQPGPEPNCAALPEGVSDCQEHYDADDGNWCFASGDPCQELMFLDFSEDGRVLGDGERPGRKTSAEEPERTCDGVILRSRVVAAGDAADQVPVFLEL